MLQRFCALTEIFPTLYILDESPCQPSIMVVTSTFKISPSSSLRSLEGIPWQITRFKEVHVDFGKPR